MTIDFKGNHFLRSVILYAVFFYVRYGVSYRDLEEIMLWAEAVYYYQQGEKWWLDGDQSDYAHSQTQQRLESDTWVEQINLKMIGANETSIKEAFELCFPTKGLDKITPADSRRMAACLLKSGWKKNGRYTGGPRRNQTRYVRVSEEN